MDLKEAIATAKQYIAEIYQDEHVSDIELEEIEHEEGMNRWRVTVAFSRPWKTPKTRAQEVLENIGAMSSDRRSVKVVTMHDDGTVASVKDRLPADVRH